MTIVVALLCYWALPGLPSKTPWLSEEERRFAVWRSAVDAMGDRVSSVSPAETILPLDANLMLLSGAAGRRDGRVQVAGR